jgi:type III restriction enzyme
MSSPVVNISALEPLFAPHEEPTKHRVRAQREGEPAQIVPIRRPSPIVIVNNLRRVVREWRETDYPGSSDTTRELLHHWFHRDHTLTNQDGEVVPFRYYFCQREAIETLIYLMEVRGLTTLSGITAEFGGEDSETAALGIDPDEDRWAKYAFKLATGAGKTKVMSLAIVWSYFHALRESDSPMAKHFVVIAPNLTVFERLRLDFGNGKIFDDDPLIPVAWKGDWNLSVVLQDEASGAATGGVLYLTNIHRLYDPSKKRTREPETYDWVGPSVSKSKALDTGEELRDRITSHRRVMLLNDEAHHVWDPDSAWNETIVYLHDTLQKRGGTGLVAQLDFSATPKDNKGQIFKHVVCDTPLGEAVDGGIVKTPIIGRGQKLTERASDDASLKYEQHLRIGYERWLKSKDEWEQSGKKALMFVMTNDTDDANAIAKRLDTDPVFKELNGKTVNLHTNLKGKLKKVGKGESATVVFVENEKEISDEDLKELRKLSRELDSNKSPYRCIVSVLMLREGWDVRNVTTIVPLRPYSSKANILPEQTLGRGLRRMTPPGPDQANETVTVVEHSAFVNLYKEQLSQEGLDIEIIDVEKVPKTTVTVFVDKNKDLKKLDLLLPQLSGGFRRTPVIENLTLEDVKKEFSKYKPLPVGEVRSIEIQYEGRHLITNEIVEQMKIQLPLLESGIGAISFFREELEKLTSLKGTHQVLAPLIESFLTEILFEQKLDLFDQRLVNRLADTDVREHVRATFVPLLLAKTTFFQERLPEEEPVSVTTWKPYQVTHSENRPAIPAANTPFNLVPCNREFEVAMVSFLDKAPDVAAFCKNAGPQSLRIDYLTGSGRLAFYTADFIVRKTDGHYLLVETKGREDKDVPLKTRAAIGWCKAASGKIKWEYLYVPQEVFHKFDSNKIADLVRTCAPSLTRMVQEDVRPQLALAFEEPTSAEAAGVDAFISKETFQKLPTRYQKAIEQAVVLFRFLERKKDVSFSPVFTSLLGPLDEAARGLILDALLPYVPKTPQEQKGFFDPYYKNLHEKDQLWLKRHANNLKRTLIDRNGLWPSGLLQFCLDYALNSKDEVAGVFEAVKESFVSFAKESLLQTVTQITDFRNKYVAHQDTELTDVKVSSDGLKMWIAGLVKLYQSHH